MLLCTKFTDEFESIELLLYMKTYRNICYAIIFKSKWFADIHPVYFIWAIGLSSQ